MYTLMNSYYKSLDLNEVVHDLWKKSNNFVHRMTDRYHALTVWSVGHHGPTDILVEKLNPLLMKYKVAAYFSGHDHDMQHISDSNVQYFLSGAGHLVESSQKHMVHNNSYFVSI